MQAIDFFRSRIDAMINMSDPLAVLASRLPWSQIEAAVATKFERQNRAGEILKPQDMFGSTETLVGAGRSNAGRPKLPICLMASLLYLKHSLNLSDEELVVRWSVNVLWQYFSGQTYYEHRLPCDATQIGRFRRDLGVVSHKHGLMMGARTFPGNPYDGHIPSAVLEQATNLTQDVGLKIKPIVVDLRFRGVDAANPDKEIIHRGKFKSLSKQQKALAQAQNSGRASHWALEVRPSYGSLLVTGLARRRLAHDCLCCGLQPALATARHCPPGH